MSFLYSILLRTVRVILFLNIYICILISYLKLYYWALHNVSVAWSSPCICQDLIWEPVVFQLVQTHCPVLWTYPAGCSYQPLYVLLSLFEISAGPDFTWDLIIIIISIKKSPNYCLPHNPCLFSILHCIAGWNNLSLLSSPVTKPPVSSRSNKGRDMFCCSLQGLPVTWRLLGMVRCSPLVLLAQKVE